MKRIHTTITAAILATTMAGGLALAADAAVAQATDPATAGQQTGAGPDVKDLDTNAQRAHSPSGNTGAATPHSAMGAAAPDVKDLDSNAQRAHDPQGATQAQGAATSSRGTGNASGDASVAASGETRDWSQIDADNDNLISPEEMEQALKAPSPQAREQR